MGNRLIGELKILKEASTLDPSAVTLASVPQGTKKERLLKTVQSNGWYKWVMYTAENSRMDNCLLLWIKMT